MAGCFRSFREQVPYCRIIGLGIIKRKLKNGYTILLFFRMELFLLGRSRSGDGAGVGVDAFRPESESELELFEIRRLRSPGRN